MTKNQERVEHYAIRELDLSVTPEVLCILDLRSPAQPLEEPIKLVEGNSRLTLHTNSSNGRFIINLHLGNNNSTKAKIELVNMLGQPVYTENGRIANGKLQQTVSMPSLAAHGMYTVRVIANKKVYREKLIYTK